MTQEYRFISWSKNEEENKPPGADEQADQKTYLDWSTRDQNRKCSAKHDLVTDVLKSVWHI